MVPSPGPSATPRLDAKEIIDGRLLRNASHSRGSIRVSRLLLFSTVDLVPDLSVAQALNPVQSSDVRG